MLLATPLVPVKRGQETGTKLSENFLDLGEPFLSFTIKSGEVVERTVIFEINNDNVEEIKPKRRGRPGRPKKFTTDILSSTINSIDKFK